MSEEKNTELKKKNNISNIIQIIIIVLIILAYLLSPKLATVTSGLYNQYTEESQKNVELAFGTEKTEENFDLYFYWYNVIHELGHGLIYYNDGVDVSVVEEEQLVNNFAVAFWRYYGEEEKLKELEDIVNYAVINVSDHYQKGDDYMELAKANSSEKSFNKSFYNFSDYGYFQFSAVKHSLDSDITLEQALEDMGIKDVKLTEKKLLKYDKINQEVSDQIIQDAVEIIKGWGAKYPKVVHHYHKNPNENFFRPAIKFLGLFEIMDVPCMIIDIYF